MRYGSGRPERPPLASETDGWTDHGGERNAPQGGMGTYPRRWTETAKRRRLVVAHPHLFCVSCFLFFPFLERAHHHTPATHPET